MTSKATETMLRPGDDMYYRNDGVVWFMRGAERIDVPNDEKETPDHKYYIGRIHEIGDIFIIARMIAAVCGLKLVAHRHHDPDITRYRFE